MKKLPIFCFAACLISTSLTYADSSEMSYSAKTATSPVAVSKQQWLNNRCFEVGVAGENSKMIPITQLKAETDRYYCGDSARFKAGVESAYHDAVTSPIESQARIQAIKEFFARYDGKVSVGDIISDPQAIQDFCRLIQDEKCNRASVAVAFVHEGKFQAVTSFSDEDTVVVNLNDASIVKVNSDLAKMQFTHLTQDKTGRHGFLIRTWDPTTGMHQAFFLTDTGTRNMPLDRTGGTDPDQLLSPDGTSAYSLDFVKSPKIMSSPIGDSWTERLEK